MKRNKDKGKKVDIRLNKRIYNLLCEIYSGNKDNMSFKEFISRIITESVKQQFPQIGICYDNDDGVEFKYNNNYGKPSKKYTFDGIRKQPLKKK